MKTSVLLGILAPAVLGFFSLPVHPQEQLFSTDVRVQGAFTLDTLDDQPAPPLLYFKGASSGSGGAGVGASISYEDGTTGSLILRMNRAQAEWRWQVWDPTETDRLQMKLDNDSVLTLVDPTNAENRILISPGGETPGITVNGSRLLTTFDLATFAGNINGGLSVSTDGLVGIGTTTPSKKLDIYGDTDDRFDFRVKNASTGTSAQSRVTFESTGASSLDIGILGSGNTQLTNAHNAGFMWNENNADLIFGTNNLERLRILAEGNVGVGTTNPSTKLTVAGAGDALTVTSDSSIQNIAGFSTPMGSKFIDTSAYTVPVVMHATSNQATSRPQILVSNSSSGQWALNFMGMAVHGAAFSYAGNSDYYLNDGMSDAGLAVLWAQGTEISKFAIGTYGAAPVAFMTSNSERLSITASGEVGIGTSAPQAQLDVHGDARFSGRVRIEPQGDISMGEFTQPLGGL